MPIANGDLRTAAIYRGWKTPAARLAYLELPIRGWKPSFFQEDADCRMVTVEVTKMIWNKDVPTTTEVGMPNR